MNVLIVKLTGYIGNDTSLTVSPEPLFMVVNAISGAELDNGYRSFEEAQEAWNDHDIMNKGENT